MSDWPQWYCQVCGEADGSNADECSDCNDYVNRPQVTSEYDDLLPQLPAEHSWLVVREVVRTVVRDEVQTHPKVYVALQDDRYAGESRYHGRIDVGLYGDGAAVLELARDLLRRFEEDS